MTADLPHRRVNVLIVGAGPAGLGCAAALADCQIPDVAVVDSKSVGASFAAWPVQMKLLTPSFNSNNFGAVDLNAITPDTSPADYCGFQHPTGQEYARYLQAVSLQREVTVSRAAVRRLKRVAYGFHVECDKGIFQARFVIWAAGEFAHPDWQGIRGADQCLHSSQVQDWAALPGDQFTIVGGYESGLDTAMHLAWLGKEVSLLSRGEPWLSRDSDPSRAISPRTRDRLRRCLLNAPGKISFFKNADIVEITEVDGQGWELTDSDGTPFFSRTKPILATGFRSALEIISQHFLWRDGHAVLSEEADESTTTPGLFYAGPSLMHRGASFCFIYKFRSRFGIIARAIAQRLGLEWEEPLKLWRSRGFMLEDLDCCADCQCAVENEERTGPEAAEFPSAHSRKQLHSIIDA
jgi:putative flavoprotein involved in K+ transport